MCIISDTPSTAAPATTSVSDSVLLVDVLGGGAAPITSPELSGLEVTPGSEEGFLKFQFKNNGVLFENDILQIGVKAEYKTYLGMYIHRGGNYTAPCDYLWDYLWINHYRGYYLQNWCIHYA